MPYPKPKLTLITSFPNPPPSPSPTPKPEPQTEPKPPFTKESCLQCAILSLRCSFNSRTNPSSNTSKSCTRCLRSNEDICVHRIKTSSLPYTNTSIPSNPSPNTSNTSSPLNISNIKDNGMDKDDGKPKYGAALIAAQLKHFKPEFIHHTPLPHITPTALSAKITSLLLPQKERDRFVLPLPSPGYGRRTLRPLSKRLEAERLESEEEERGVRRVVRDVRERVEGEMKRERAREVERERVEMEREETKQDWEEEKKRFWLLGGASRRFE